MATSKDELIATAKRIAKRSEGSEELKSASPELIAALESAAKQLSHAAGGRSDLAELVGQVNQLINQSKNK